MCVRGGGASVSRHKMSDGLIILVAVQRKFNQFSLLFWDGLIGCDILARTTKS